MGATRAAAVERGARWAAVAVSPTGGVEESGGADSDSAKPPTGGCAGSARQPLVVAVAATLGESGAVRSGGCGSTSASCATLEVAAAEDAAAGGACCGRPCGGKMSSRLGPCLRAKAGVQGWIRRAATMVILRPLGMTDADPAVQTRIERMVVSTLYTFFKSIISAVIEIVRGWLWAGIVLMGCGAPVLLLFFCAVRWRKLALTFSFFAVNLVGFFSSLGIWTLMLQQTVRSHRNGLAPDHLGLKIFSIVTLFLLVVAQLMNSIDSLHFAKFLSDDKQAVPAKTAAAAGRPVEASLWSATSLPPGCLRGLTDIAVGDAGPPRRSKTRVSDGAVPSNLAV